MVNGLMVNDKMVNGLMVNGILHEILETLETLSFKLFN
jgi:hypothetical protein